MKIEKANKASDLIRQLFKLEFNLMNLESKKCESVTFYNENNMTQTIDNDAQIDIPLKIYCYTIILLKEEINIIKYKIKEL